MGIIPACAGSTFWTGNLRIIRRDHPRMCGEHIAPTSISTQQKGSSPHVRGAPAAVRGIGAPTGIIPACAGSTTVFKNGTHRRRDHPRMCGEHKMTILQHEIAGGSSPHVRGAHPTRARRRLRRGIIPACAGSTGGQIADNRDNGDHPRMCGEHQAYRRPTITNLGSSPHVRGARIGVN